MCSWTHPFRKRCQCEAEEVAEVRHTLAGVQVVKGHFDDAVVLVLSPAGDAALGIERQEVPPHALRCTAQPRLSAVEDAAAGGCDRRLLLSESRHL